MNREFKDGEGIFTDNSTARERYDVFEQMLKHKPNLVHPPYRDGDRPNINKRGWIKWGTFMTGDGDSQTLKKQPLSHLEMLNRIVPEVGREYIEVGKFYVGYWDNLRVIFMQPKEGDFYSTSKHYLDTEGEYMFNICLTGRSIRFREASDLEAEQLKKHLSPEDMAVYKPAKEVKKIVGYKLKPEYEYMRENVEAIAYGNRESEIPLEKYLEREMWGKVKERLEEADVLDLWFEPVYEDDEVKIDRWEGKINKHRDIVFGCQTWGRDWLNSDEGQRIVSMTVISEGDRTVEVSAKDLNKVRRLLKLDQVHAG